MDAITQFLSSDAGVEDVAASVAEHREVLESVQVTLDAHHRFLGSIPPHSESVSNAMRRSLDASNIASSHLEKIRELESQLYTFSQGIRRAVNEVSAIQSLSGSGSSAAEIRSSPVHQRRSLSPSTGGCTTRLSAKLADRKKRVASPAESTAQHLKNADLRHVISTLESVLRSLTNEASESTVSLQSSMAPHPAATDVSDSVVRKTHESLHAELCKWGLSSAMLARGGSVQEGERAVTDQVEAALRQQTQEQERLTAVCEDARKLQAVRTRLKELVEDTDDMEDALEELFRRERDAIEKQEKKYCDSVEDLRRQFHAQRKKEMEDIEALRNAIEEEEGKLATAKETAYQNYLANPLHARIQELRELIFQPMLQEFFNAVKERRLSQSDKSNLFYTPEMNALVADPNDAARFLRHAGRTFYPTSGTALDAVRIDEIEGAGVRNYLRELRTAQAQAVGNGNIPEGEKELLIVYDTVEKRYRIADFSASNVGGEQFRDVRQAPVPAHIEEQLRPNRGGIDRSQSFSALVGVDHVLLRVLEPQ